MRPGDLAPDFTLNDHDATRFTLSEALRAGPVVLFFYPAAMSRGCTKETCHFRDLAAEFAAYGAQRVGISMDDAGRQARFARKNSVDFPLLSDPGGAVARLYGVKRGVDVLRVRRTTFVIDVDTTILEVVTSEISMDAHADRALEALARRDRGGRT
ncbi:MAG: peroxiredoxin [Acidobacteriota bacterium]|nr:peroxiredoxin [Acidobacteriota bacterium]MDE3146729.1 peroxiredoxin [Acidobacteriota bacterium]